MVSDERRNLKRAGGILLGYTVVNLAMSQNVVYFVSFLSKKFLSTKRESLEVFRGILMLGQGIGIFFLNF